VTAVRRTLVACSLVGVLASAFAGYASRADANSRGDAARRGADWIAAEQADDGGFFGSGQRVDQTAETLAAMIAGGVTGRPVKRAVSYLRKHAADGATRGAYTGRIVAGLIAAGENPRAFADTDFVATLDDQYDESSGAFDTENLFTNLTGANGAVAAKKELPSKAIAYIADNACGDGGFGFENGCAEGPDVDTSAWVINVLAAAGHAGDTAVASAKSYLLSVQQSDGGFGFTKDKSTSADSTGLVLSAIEALGERTTKAPWRQDDGGDPVKALLQLQDASGGFRFIASSKSPNALSTQNAVPGLAKVAYPIPKVEATASPKPSSAASAQPSRPSPAPRASGAARPVPGSGATSTATQASPGASGAATSGPSGRTITFTPQPSAPFGSASQPLSDETIPAPVLWAGLGVVVAGAGAGTWLWLRRRPG
jgi:hypothetical protein